MMKCWWAPSCAGNPNCSEFMGATVCHVQEAVFHSTPSHYLTLTIFLPFFLGVPAALGWGMTQMPRAGPGMQQSLILSPLKPLGVSALNLTHYKWKPLWGRWRAALTGCWLYSGWSWVPSLGLQWQSQSSLCISRVQGQPFTCKVSTLVTPCQLLLVFSCKCWPHLCGVLARVLQAAWNVLEKSGLYFGSHQIFSSFHAVWIWLKTHELIARFRCKMFPPAEVFEPLVPIWLWSFWNLWKVDLDE